MPKIKKILFPVDFTFSTDKILPYVREMAQTFDAKLYIIHVVRSAEEFAGFDMGAAWYSSLERDLMKGAEKSMKRLAAEKLDDLGEVDTHIAVGDVVDEIINYVKKQGIDMIIIGTHGRKGLEKVMFGSVAEGVIKEAPCPVLTINPHTITT